MQPLHLLVIDPQNDFCDLPDPLLPIQGAGGRMRPALPVPGAHQDMVRLARWIRGHVDALDAVTLTLDQHHRLDIAHPPFWRRADGGPVQPFTPILARQVEAGEFQPATGLDRQRALTYLKDLESQARTTHMVWPIHCQIGTWGAAVHAGLQDALDLWEDTTGRQVAHVAKGTHPWTEHYSAIQAEIPDPDEPATLPNQDLLRMLADSRTLVIAGEAGSHCVRATVEHIVASWPHAPERIVLAVDAMSPVPGFETVQDRFLETMANRGVRTLPLDAIPH
ncbi:MAG: cysteine hydrolase [Fibrobacteria bacterium]|nr:cysteine hydrolase [Fibrobacteria bacterium]